MRFSHAAPSVSFARRAVLAAAAIASAWLLLPSAALACPMCKGALSPEEELKQEMEKIAAKLEQKQATKEEAAAMLATAQEVSSRRVGSTKGFAYSIYFMLMAPVAIFAILAMAVVKTARDNMRRAEALREQAEAEGVVEAFGEPVAQS